MFSLRFLSSVPFFFSSLSVPLVSLTLSFSPFFRLLLFFFYFSFQFSLPLLSFFLLFLFLLFSPHLPFPCLPRFHYMLLLYSPSFYLFFSSVSFLFLSPFISSCFPSLSLLSSVSLRFSFFPSPLLLFPPISFFLPASRIFLFLLFPFLPLPLSTCFSSSFAYSPPLLHSTSSFSSSFSSAPFVIFSSFPPLSLCSSIFPLPLPYLTSSIFFSIPAFTSPSSKFPLPQPYPTSSIIYPPFPTPFFLFLSLPKDPLD